MRSTKFLFTTKKEMPSGTDPISQQYMLRAGFIRKISSGIYTWLPTGMRILKNIESLIRNSMNTLDANELILPTILPIAMLKKTGRLEKFGNELLVLKDRYGKYFYYAPTHEEPAVDLIKNTIRSYKQLPVILYQIQTKFRDEIRPRYGIMRAREFIMKDAYSFHINQKCLEKMYSLMYRNYSNILIKMGLKFRIIKADSGSIGGNVSHEFQVLSDIGEDTICYSSSKRSNYIANLEFANYLNTIPSMVLKPAMYSKNRKASSINFTDISLLKSFRSDIGTYLIKDNLDNNFLITLSYFHKINILKISRISHIFFPIRLLYGNQTFTEADAKFDFVSSSTLSTPIILDYSVYLLDNLTCSVIGYGVYYTRVNWNKDIKNFLVANIRNVVNGDLSPDGKGLIEISNSIEVGHIFQLGNYYSETMDASVLNEHGKKKDFIIGCYGIGIGRILAATIEQLHDEKGIILPDDIAPFKVIIIPINMCKSKNMHLLAKKIYFLLKASKFDVLLDDRKERAGVMFADADLIGIPHQIIITQHQLLVGNLMYKARKSQIKRVLHCDYINNLFKKN